MCQDREHTPDDRDTPGTHAKPIDRRLPRGARLLVRSMFAAGVLVTLASLPMPACYGTWSYRVCPTWNMIFFGLLIATVLIITAPLVAWWIAGVIAATIWVSRPSGPRRSVLVPALSAGFLLAWFEPWAGLRQSEAYPGDPLLWGSVVLEFGS